MEIAELKKLAYEIEKDLGNEFENISDFLFKNPEVSGEEYISSKFLVERMKKYGFKVVYPYCNLPTAFRAEIGDGEGPIIAFLAEYDALPGYGENGEPGHACGHNWISATTAGAAIVLSKLKEHFKGKIVLMGTPAEETFGGKCDMVREGGFRDIDIVLQAHLEEFHNINCKALAMDGIEFKFKGKATHAASYPHEGINALDAVQLTFAGINALRQHVKPDVRMHGIVTKGGEAPNIVPDNGVCKFYVRASERKYLNEVSQKVINCAKGASLMTGAKLTYSYFENPFDNLINVPMLQELMKKNLAEVGITDLYEGDEAPTGSTDIGNVSYVCPTMYVEISPEADERFFTHEQGALKYVNSSYSNKKLHQIVNAMVGVSLELYRDMDKVEEIKAWHKHRVE